MRKALYRQKSAPSIDMSRKRRERGGKPLTKKLDKNKVKKYRPSLYKRRSFGRSRSKYGAVEKKS